MPKQTNRERALIALLGSSSIREAAKLARLSEETIYRFLREPDFIYEYRDARRQSVEAAISKLQAITTRAVDTLARNLDCENPAVETRTAQIVLDSAMKGIELIDIVERLESIESEHKRPTGKTREHAS